MVGYVNLYQQVEMVALTKQSALLVAGVFAVAVCVFLAYKKHSMDILLVIGLTAIFYAVTGHLSNSMIAAAFVALIMYYVMVGRKEGFEDAPKEEKAEKKNPPPDHADRAEMFELGKAYKMPNEKDDSEFHLDAGTTFMNAYKALKPDQIAAMTKDTQELMETQKQLMSTLHTLKPLITDGKQMMEMFQSYFGNGSPTTA
jgi:Ca2+/Na+ antiporter